MAKNPSFPPINVCFVSSCIVTLKQEDCVFDRADLIESIRLNRVDLIEPSRFN
jgi:hypothetical protein